MLTTSQGMTSLALASCGSYTMHGWAVYTMHMGRCKVIMDVVWEQNKGNWQVRVILRIRR